jgi:hypothetical protein
MKSRDCEFTDGYIDLDHDQCKGCCTEARNLCKIFALRNGLRNIEYFFTEESVEIDERSVNFLNRIKGINK